MSAEKDKEYQDRISFLEKENKGLKREMLKAIEYGYDYHQNSQFPKLSFDENCKNNALQWIEYVVGKHVLKFINDNKMEWIKITEENKPPFNQVVFLMEKSTDDNPSKVDAGSLKSIDANGLNWNLSSQSLFGFESMFSFSTVKKGYVMNPTHYCIIEVPKD